MIVEFPTVPEPPLLAAHFAEHPPGRPTLPGTDLDELFHRSPCRWHPSVCQRQSLVRFGVDHLRYGYDSVPVKLERCLSPSGAYFVPGLGRRWWAEVAVAVCAEPIPCWHPDIEAGGRRIGWIESRTAHASAEAFTQLCRAYKHHFADHPTHTPRDLDFFLRRVARMRGRQLPDVPTDDLREQLETALRHVRNRTPLRDRLTSTTAPPPRTPLALTGWRTVDDAAVVGLSEAEETELFREFSTELSRQLGVHPLEINDVLERVATPDGPSPTGQFLGFTADTFRFFAELTVNNNREWMDRNRGRYRFAVRDAMAELGTALTDRYLAPVLTTEYRWPLAGDPLTRINRNDYGQSDPYWNELWLTFHRPGGRQTAAQLFVKLDATGLSYGFGLQPTARADGRRLRTVIQQNPVALFDALAATDAFATVRFGQETIRTPEDLRRWATSKALVAARHLPPTDDLLRRDALVGEVLLTFDRLVPLFAAATVDDSLPILHSRSGRMTATGYDGDRFDQETHLSAVWRDRVQGLLKLKKQLVLRGVSGTGKTHVAKALARLLTGDRPDAIQFVQFHPGYTYDEFVEHARPDGTIEDGLLLRFVARAAKRPAETFVLILDDLTRGPLGVVMGELLYLLEYRGETVTLPGSKRSVRLPGNVLLVATADASDTNTTAFDRPLRRRFAFLDLQPDTDVLVRWHVAHGTDPVLARRVAVGFEKLNQRLAREFGPNRRLGHSVLMVPELTADRLRNVWDHHIRPLLDADQRPDDADFDRWFAGIFDTRV